MFSAPLTSGVSTPSRLEGSDAGGKSFTAMSWSPDGARLTGPLVAKSGQPAGVGVYELSARKTIEISADATYAAQWFADSRRVIYFTTGGQLVVVYTATRARTVVEVRLPGLPTTDVFALSPDNKTIYYGATRTEADIWIVERK